MTGHFKTCAALAFHHGANGSRLRIGFRAMDLAKGRIRSAEKCCQMFDGSFDADTAARMWYQSGPQLFANGTS
jgi:hypothetical protein